jgi:hypothetical protein
MVIPEKLMQDYDPAEVREFMPLLHMNLFLGSFRCGGHPHQAGVVGEYVQTPYDEVVRLFHVKVLLGSAAIPLYRGLIFDSCASSSLSPSIFHAIRDLDRVRVQ